MLHYNYEFSGRIESLDFGRMVYKVIWLPKDLEEQLSFAKFPRLRINAEIAGVLTNCTFQINAKSRYLLVSSELMKQTGAELHKLVKVRRSIADQTAVDIPHDFELALEKNPRARTVWNSLSPGKKRGYVHRIASAKRDDTREKRIFEVLDNLMDTEVT